MSADALTIAKTRREIGLEIAKITPFSNTSIEVFYLDVPKTKKQIIVFHVTTDSTKRPYSYNGRAYVRIQSDTLPKPESGLSLKNDGPASFGTLRQEFILRGLTFYVKNLTIFYLL